MEDAEAIGAIDWFKMIEAAAGNSMGMVALVIILISIVGYFMLRGTSEHYSLLCYLVAA